MRIILSFVFMITATQIGNVVCNIGSALIMTYIDWQWVYYLWGLCGVFWYLIYRTTVYNNPYQHPFISENEKAYLSELLPPTSDMVISYF